MIEGSRYVRAVARTTAPVILITVAAETVPVGTSKRGDTTHRQGHAVWTTYGRRNGVKWSGPETPTRHSLEAFWTWLAALNRAGRRLYVIAPCASDFLTLTSFWCRAESGEYAFIASPSGTPCQSSSDPPTRRPWKGRLVLRGIPDIVHAMGTPSTVIFTSAGNWTPASPIDLASAVGMHFDPVNDPSCLQDQVELRPEFAAEALARYFRSLMARWVESGNGPWRETVGSLAVSLWRRRFYTEHVCRHKDETGRDLEARAAHGGRASVWFYGDVGRRSTLPTDAQPDPPFSRWALPGTEVHKLDVRSMYPAILRDELLPTRLLAVKRSVTLPELKALVKLRGVIATVSLNARHAEYPKKYDDRTRYPTGRFITTLAGPELGMALAGGEVVEVGETAIYDLGRPLQAVASYLLDERAKCRKAGDRQGEMLYKLMANALGGKFAQRADSWVVDTRIQAAKYWGEWIEAKTATRPSVRCRAICGVVHRQQRGKPGGKLLAAIYGYMTSHGRCRMREVREQLGADTVLSQDTDGLWITDAGMVAADERGLVGGDEPGNLRYVESCGFARWLSPKHYYHGGRWVLSGITGGFTGGSGLLFDESIRLNPVRFTPSAAPDRIQDKTRRIDLRGICPDVPVNNATGWADPWFVSHERPEPWHVHEERLDDFHD